MLNAASQGKVAQIAQTYQLVSLRWGCTNLLAFLPFLSHLLLTVIQDRWNPGAAGSSCWVSLSHNVMGQHAASAGRSGSHASAHKELKWPEPETQRVFEYMHGESCALCLSILWHLRDQDIRHGFDRQRIWVMWLAATHYQPGSALI